MEQRIILALDEMELSPALKLASSLSRHVAMVKVNALLDTTPIGRFVNIMRGEAYRLPVMSDPKFYDIPKTVWTRVREHALSGARFITIHIGDEDNREMVEAALNAADGTNAQIIGVTRLTSKKQNIADVKKLADLAYDWGVTGIVCAGPDLKRIQPKRFKTVITPGVRSEGVASHDQKRVMTPREAVESGATYVVIGREIYGAQNPIGEAQRINKDLEMASSKAA